MSQPITSQPFDTAADGVQDDVSRFKAVLDDIKLHNIPALASCIRQNGDVNLTSLNHDFFAIKDPSQIDCDLVGKPLYGSSHIAFRVRFEDSVEWLLKVPGNGHHGCFNSLAARSLTSEALTMCIIKRETTVPVPAVHGFDTTMSNEIGCPYILMDFALGKPLHEGWFDRNASPARLEQFRARALQSIANAMVQLNKYQFNQGGALHFDQNGKVAVTEGAKVMDSLTAFDNFANTHHGEAEDEAAVSDETFFCEKGPFTDPAAALFFMLNRRGPHYKDSLHDQGVRRSVRLFTEWARGQVDVKGPQFVLGHPDFNFQNILVEEDGNLSAIIHWDGVAAVPHSVGCLKYPMWLMRDWDLHYVNPAEEECSGDCDPENTPEELEGYRAIYAQFIETTLTNITNDSKASRALADTTRLSLLTATLEAADNTPMFILELVYKLYKGIEHMVEDDSGGDSSDTGSVHSEKTFDSDEEDRETEASEIEDVEEPENTEHDVHRERCVAEKMQAALLVEDRPETSKLHEAKDAKLLAPQISYSLPDTSNDKAMKASRSAKVGKFFCGLGEKGFRKATGVLHRKKGRDLETGVMPHIVKIRGTNDTCDGEEELLSKTQRKSTSVERKWQQLTKILHRGDTEASKPDNTSEATQGQERRIKTFLRWLFAKIHQLLSKPQAPGTNNTETPIDLEAQMNEVVQLNTEHSLNCPKHQQKLEGGKHQVELDVEGAWARIVHAVEYDGVSPPQTEGQNASIVGRTLPSMKENPKWAKMAAQAARKAGKFGAQSVVSYQGAEKQACESGQPSAKTHISRTSRDKLEDRLSCAEILDPVEMKHTAANSTYPELPLAEITNLAIVDRHI